MNIKDLISDEALATAGQLEFADMLRNEVANGSTSIEIIVDPSTALTIAKAMDIYNLILQAK